MDLSSLPVDSLARSLTETVSPLLTSNGALVVVASAAFVLFRMYGVFIAAPLRLAIAVLRLFTTVPMLGAAGVINDLTRLSHRMAVRRPTFTRALFVALVSGAVYYTVVDRTTAPRRVEAPSAVPPQCSGELVELSCPSQ